jgi:hypothetical protein
MIIHGCMKMDLGKKRDESWRKSAFITEKLNSENIC